MRPGSIVHPLSRSAARRCSAAALALSATLVPGLAAAQARVAVYELALEGQLAGLEDAPLLDALESGLRPTATQVIEPAEVERRVAAAGQGAGPGEAGWRRLVGVALEADALLAVRVDQLEQHYAVEVEMRLARDGSLLAETALECAACTWEEALATVTRAGRGLAAALPGALTVEVSPEDARVTVDGSRIEPGVAVALSPGAHRVEARRAGLGSVSRQATVVAGGTTSVALALAPSAGGGEPGRAGSRPWWTWAWVTAAASVAALVPGVLWLALDGRCPVGWDQSDGICPEVYDLWPQGLALTAVGAALISASATLFAFDAFRGRRPASRSGISMGPALCGAGCGGLSLSSWF